MPIRPIAPSDIEPLVPVLISAFAHDPLIAFLFGRDWQVRPNAGTFFRTLLEVRVRLRMPAFCVDSSGATAGAVMGYDTTRPEWSSSETERWRLLLDSEPGLSSRLHAYEALADQFQPLQPHYYLGVIGVAAGLQGSGLGALLLDHFCEQSVKDPNSTGVYLETASQASLGFYLKRGFEILGEGNLNPVTRLWCVFKSTR